MRPTGQTAPQNVFSRAPNPTSPFLGLDPSSTIWVSSGPQRPVTPIKPHSWQSTQNGEYRQNHRGRVARCPFRPAIRPADPRPFRPSGPAAWRLGRESRGGSTGRRPGCPCRAAAAVSWPGGRTRSAPAASRQDRLMRPVAIRPPPAARRRSASSRSSCRSTTIAGSCGTPSPGCSTRRCRWRSSWSSSMTARPTARGSRSRSWRRRTRGCGACVMRNRVARGRRSARPSST